MLNESHPRPRWQSDLIFFVPCLVVALLVRVFFFNGVALADDVNYWTQAIATGLDGDWPPLDMHWHTRAGFILPCALLLKVFGLKLWVPFVFTMLGGLLEVVLTLYVARHFVTETAARIAAWLCVFFPLNIVYSSYLYVDLWAGVLGALSLFFWDRALLGDRIRHYLLASFFFGLAWLFRETIVMCVPIYVVIWLQARRWHSPKFLWVLPPAILVLVGEAAVYWFSTGNWHYRLDAIMESRGQLSADFVSVKNFWVQPFVELLTSHELGLFMIGSLIIAILHYPRIPRVLTWWLLAGFGWLCWGTTLPFAWVPLQGDPRYLTVLTVPCLIVLAVFAAHIRSAMWRGAFIGLLIVSGLLCAAADIGPTKLSAHRRLVVSRYNQPTTALEPFVYFGARAAQDFQPAEARYACASDLGRASALLQMHSLPGTRFVPSAGARYLVLSAQIQSEKWQQKQQEGWKRVDVIQGDSILVRNLAVKFLTLFGQPTRREPVVRWPVLVVLENPVWPPTNSPSP